MKEDSRISHSLAVEVRNSEGRVKDARYIKDGIEFVPNRLYLHLLNRGMIASDTFKIPFLLGSRHKEIEPSWVLPTQPEQ